MAASRRRTHSRTPVNLMADEALLMVQAANTNAFLREGAELFTGRTWDSMDDGEKVRALLEADSLARAAGAMAGGFRGMRDLKQEMDIARSADEPSAPAPQPNGDEVAAARVERLEAENAALRMQLRGGQAVGE